MVTGDRCSAAYSEVNVEIGENKVSCDQENLGAVLTMCHSGVCRSRGHGHV